MNIKSLFLLTMLFIFSSMKAYDEAGGRLEQRLMREYEAAVKKIHSCHRNKDSQIQALDAEIKALTSQTNGLEAEMVVIEESLSEKEIRFEEYHESLRDLERLLENNEKDKRSIDELKKSLIHIMDLSRDQSEQMELISQLVNEKVNSEEYANMDLTKQEVEIEKNKEIFMNDLLRKFEDLSEIDGELREEYLSVVETISNSFYRAEEQRLYFEERLSKKKRAVKEVSREILSLRTDREGKIDLIRNNGVRSSQLISNKVQVLSEKAKCGDPNNP